MCSRWANMGGLVEIFHRSLEPIPLSCVTSTICHLRFTFGVHLGPFSWAILRQESQLLLMPWVSWVVIVLKRLLYIHNNIIPWLVLRQQNKVALACPIKSFRLKRWRTFQEVHWNAKYFQPEVGSGSSPTEQAQKKEKVCKGQQLEETGKATF